ncbi:hypothetical protein ACU686_12435 [Yinghuangia aomiensis]
MEDDLPTVRVRLWRADAIVLFDWLMSTDLDSVPVTHPARSRPWPTSWSRLEWAADSDVTGSTAEEIAAAQQEVARDMGW